MNKKNADKLYERLIREISKADKDSPKARDLINRINDIRKSKGLKLIKESVITEDRLDEKLITFSNRASYGQAVFLAGGAASGKDFAINNFIDSGGYKVRDVDEMKKQAAKLDKLESSSFTIDKWYKKYASKLGPNEYEYIMQHVINPGKSISDIYGDLKDQNNVSSLHYIISAMGWRDIWLINMMKGKSNPKTLPNIIFNMTAKNIKSITNVVKTLTSTGYDSKNIHLIWVLNNYTISADWNRGRPRVVRDDIHLETHEGAAKTVWSIVTKAVPSGINGRIDVILNNKEHTIHYFHDADTHTGASGAEEKDKKFKKKGEVVGGTAKGFLSLPVKAQGSGIFPESKWKDILFNWIKQNAPKGLNI